MNDKAFTLVELTVTVSILAIIAALAVQIFEEYRTKANNVIALLAHKDAYTIVEALKDDFLIGTDGTVAATASCMVGAKYTGANAVFTDSNHTMEQTISDMLSDKVINNEDVWINIVMERQVNAEYIGWTISAGHCDGNILYWWFDTIGAGVKIISNYYDDVNVFIFKTVHCP